MVNYLYHGSHAPGIETLHANSKLHGTEDTMVVYLTANPAYALFYSIGNCAFPIEQKTLRCGCARFCRGRCRINATQKRRESFASETLCSIYLGCGA